MALVHVTDVKIFNNPTKFTDNFQFQITFNSVTSLPYGMSPFVYLRGCKQQPRVEGLHQIHESATLSNVFHLTLTPLPLRLTFLDMAIFFMWPKRVSKFVGHTGRRVYTTNPLLLFRIYYRCGMVPHICR